MGGTTAPVSGSASWPAWIASVSNPPPGFVVTADTLPRSGSGRGHQDPVGQMNSIKPGRSPPLRQLQQREGPVPARRDQEVLPPGRGDEPLQAIVVALAAQELLLELLCRCRGAHLGEEVGGRSRCRSSRPAPRWSAGPTCCP